MTKNADSPNPQREHISVDIDGVTVWGKIPPDALTNDIDGLSAEICIVTLLAEEAIQNRDTERLISILDTLSNLKVKSARIESTVPNRSVKASIGEFLRAVRRVSEETLGPDLTERLFEALGDQIMKPANQELIQEG